ncbi:MAG TPA: hypothetical protein VJK48_02615 [Chlamydiales bacterium]|nr:hypothetical protein [Chlamydiales bacterium]
MARIESDLAEAARQIGLCNTQANCLWEAFHLIQKKKRKASLLQVLLYVGALAIFFSLTWLYVSQLDKSRAFFLSLTYALLFFGAGAYLFRVKKLKTTGGLLTSLGVIMAPLVIYSFRAMLHILPLLPEEIPTFSFWIQSYSTQAQLALLLFASIAFIFVRFPFLTALLYGPILYIAGDLIHFYTEKTELFYFYYWPVAASIGIFLLILSFFLSKKEANPFAFWSYFFGIFSLFSSFTAWTHMIEKEWAYSLYFSIQLAILFLSRLLYRKTLLFFGSLGVIVYFCHLVYHYSNSLFFSYILAGCGFLLIMLSALLSQKQTSVDKNHL